MLKGLADAGDSNRYSFAAGNPIAYADPMGLTTIALSPPSSGLIKRAVTATSAAVSKPTNMMMGEIFKEIVKYEGQKLSLDGAVINLWTSTAAEAAPLIGFSKGLFDSYRRHTTTNLGEDDAVVASHFMMDFACNAGATAVGIASLGLGFTTSVVVCGLLQEELYAYPFQLVDAANKVYEQEKRLGLQIGSGARTVAQGTLDRAYQAGAAWSRAARWTLDQAYDLGGRAGRSTRRMGTSGLDPPGQ